MMILDKTSQYGLRVTIQKQSPASFVVAMSDYESGEMIRSKSVCSEHMANVWAERFLS